VNRGGARRLVLGSSADSDATLTLGKTAKHLTLGAGATPFSFRVAANAEKGKQKLRFELGGAVTRSVKVTVI
jgi:hypothetical protein